MYVIVNTLHKYDENGDNDDDDDDDNNNKLN